MNVFEQAMKDILHDPAMRTIATFRNRNIYGHFTNRSEIIDGVRTRVVTFELIDTDLDQPPAVGERITINQVTYTIADVDPGQYGSTILPLSKD